MKRFLPRSVDETVTGCVFLVIFAVACMMPMQNDTWWHLRTGKEMWTRRFIMLSDEFSFTTTGAPWLNHEWLSDIVFYALYTIGGLPLLTFAAAAMVTAAVGLSWRLGDRRIDHGQRLGLLALALTSIVPVWTVRPHVFTLLGVMVLLHVALRGLYWVIPLMFVLWANFHGGVALGLVVLAGVAAGEIYVSGMGRLRVFVPLIAAAFVATLITPIGFGLWQTIPVSVHKSSMNQIVEWRSPALFDGRYVAFWAAAATLVLSTWIFRRMIVTKPHAVLVAVAFAVLPLALRARRNTSPFLLVAIPALTWNLSQWMQSRGSRTTRAADKSPSAVASGAFVGCALVCAALVVAMWRIPAERLNWQPLPDAVVAHVLACRPNVFNSYGDGGYLIWFIPQNRVFIDSRQDPYSLAFLQEYIRLERTADYRTTFDRYGVNCAVLREPSMLAKRLMGDSWRTRLQAEGWLVLEAPIPPIGEERKVGLRAE